MLPILRDRELRSRSYQRQIYENLDSSFNSGNYKEIYLELDNHVTSTIAIDISQDGEYVASSHGDHTIKVFRYITGEQIRNFRGHPRTPWTVKFNPKDSNIVASGCLGYEARVWNIRLNLCLNIIKFNVAIITMSFHPSAEVLVIASGQILRLWNWRRINRLSQSVLTPEAISDLKVQDEKYRSKDIPAYYRSVSNERSIRAVVFHPSGQYILVAAPYLKREESKKIGSSGLTPCRLYCINYRDLFDDFPKKIIDLQAQPVVLSEMHVYSDGGIDISRDGKLLVVCAMLYTPISSLSVSENEASSSSLKRSYHSNFVQLSNNNNLQLSNAGNTPSGGVGWLSLWANRTLPQMTQQVNSESIFTPSSSSTINSNSNNIPSGYSTAFSTPPPQPPRRPEIFQTPTINLPSFRQVSSQRPDPINSDNIYTPEPISQSQSFPAPQPSPPGLSQPPPLTLPSPPLNRDIFDSTSQYFSQQATYGFLHPMHDGINSTFGSRPVPVTDPHLTPNELAGYVLKEHLCVFSLNIEKRDTESDGMVDASSPREVASDISSPSLMKPAKMPLLHSLIAMSRSLPNQYYDDYDNVHEFIECPVVSENEVYVKLSEAKLLTASLMKAIVSTKFSASGKYIVLGYGVRNSNKEVVDHIHPRVACEVVELNSFSSSLKSVSVFSHPEDEVNVSLFHPLPGLGLVYGTKTGKVRVFQREQYVDDSNNDDDINAEALDSIHMDSEQ